MDSWKWKRASVPISMNGGNRNMFPFPLTFATELEGFQQIGSFIVVCEQLIVCVQ
jgi:hypothetical protein